MSSIFRLFGSAFPGVIRLLIVNSVIFYFSDIYSSEFAKNFFWVSLITSFAGMAISAQMYYRGGIIKPFYRGVITIAFVSIASLVGYVFWVGDGYGAIILSALFLSLFEVERSLAAALDRFKELTLSGGVSAILILVVIFVFENNPSTTMCLSFFILAITTVVMGRTYLIGTYRPSFNVLRNIVSYSFSNGLSSGLTFVIPLILIDFYGKEEAGTIAQVFTLTSILFFLPRYMAAKYSVLFRAAVGLYELFLEFEKRSLVYCVFGTILGVFIVTNLAPSYTLLFLSLFLSQLSLPSACIHLVHGAGYEMAKLNALSFFLVVILYVLFHFGFIDTDIVNEGLYVQGIYLLSIIVRYVLTYTSALKLIQSRGVSEGASYKK